VPIEPFRKVVEVEKALVAHSNYRHLMLLGPKLNGTNVQSHTFGEGTQSNQPFAKYFDKAVVFHFNPLEYHIRKSSPRSAINVIYG
jgi:hypothetical protein